MNVDVHLGEVTAVMVEESVEVDSRDEALLGGAVNERELDRAIRAE